MKPSANVATRAGRFPRLSQAFLFGPIGTTEFLIVIVLVLLIFGSRRLPALGRNLGLAIHGLLSGLRGKSGDGPPGGDGPGSSV